MRCRRTKRAQVGELPTIASLTGTGADPHARRRDPGVRDVLLEALFASGSELLLLPIQDVFGWRDRINEPATVKSENWTFRLPWPVDRLDDPGRASGSSSCGPGRSVTDGIYGAGLQTGEAFAPLGAAPQNPGGP